MSSQHWWYLVFTLKHGVLTENWHVFRCPWQTFLDDEQEHRKWQEDRNSKWNFLSWFWRQPKHQQIHDGQEDNRDYHIDHCVSSLSLKQHKKLEGIESFKTQYPQDKSSRELLWLENVPFDFAELLSCYMRVLKCLLVNCNGLEITMILKYE